MPITNRPNHINRTEILPGISTGEDHHVVYTELDLNPHRVKQIPRRVPLLHKADWSGFKQYTRELANTINIAQNETSVEGLWNVLKNGLLDGMKLFIPHKNIKTKESKPWIDNRLRKMINRDFKESKKTGKAYYEQKCCHLKREVQYELRCAYWNHIENIVTPNENDINQFSCRNFGNS